MAAGSTLFPTNLDSNAVRTNADEITSTDHNDHSIQIEAIESKVGKDNSAITTSHDYKLSGVTGADKAVSKTGTETLTAKTLTTPKVDTINEETSANGVTVDGLNIKDGALTTANSVITANYTDGSILPEHLVTGNGTSWTWQDWTVSWTNLTVGAGGSVVSKYTLVGKTVHFRLSFVFGSGSSVGNVSFSIPVTSATYLSSGLLGTALYLDDGVTTYVGKIIWTNSTTAALRVELADATYAKLTTLSSTIPMTWGTADSIFLMGTYEAA